MIPDDNYYMEIALAEAHNRLLAGDVPVGAVIVKDNTVINFSGNIKVLDPTAHAEINAIRFASRNLKTWNLSGCTLYVTLEPCPMCAGACVNARLSRVVYGAKNYKSGAAGTLYKILQDDRLNNTCEVTSGVLETECLKLLQDYFLNRRSKN